MKVDLSQGFQEIERHGADLNKKFAHYSQYPTSSNFAVCRELQRESVSLQELLGTTFQALSEVTQTEFKHRDTQSKESDAGSQLFKITEDITRKVGISKGQLLTALSKTARIFVKSSNILGVAFAVSSVASAALAITFAVAGNPISIAVAVLLTITLGAGSYITKQAAKNLYNHPVHDLRRVANSPNFDLFMKFVEKHREDGESIDRNDPELHRAYTRFKERSIAMFAEAKTIINPATI
jgi:hypothetical protein